jgi:protein TonB
MVKFFITISLVLIWYFSSAQRVDTLFHDNVMITYIEKPPLFSGNLKDFIRKQVRYPEEAQKDSLEGTVFISFWIDTLGITIDHQVIRGIRKDMDEEAIRIAKLIKFEKPATQRGKPIKVYFVVPVEFKLSNCSENENKKKVR